MTDMKKTVSIQRRDMLKMGAAGVLAAGTGQSLAEEPREGTFQDNGVDPALRLRNDRISDEAKKVLGTLKCVYTPVAVKFLAVKPENFGISVPHIDKKMSLCQFVSHAQRTGEAFYIQKEDENCVGRSVLGMMKESPIGLSGQAGFDFGVYRTQAPNSRLYYNIPTLLPGTCNYVVFAPIAKCEFNPDVVVFLCETPTADIILRATSYISGDLWESKSSSVVSCSWTYVWPWLTGKVNHLTTGMHHGMNRRKVYTPGLHIIAVPYQKLDELVLALRQMDWKLISFRPDDKSQETLKKRMRNWNNLAKQIESGGSFELPENKVK